ncbi:hypothetical protein CsSME_00047744 [Camellia sinensis var. sinensis]
MEFPDGVILKFKSVFTSEYLRPTDDSHLSADEKDPKNPMVRFTLEKARDGLWRIKCLATNKYWKMKPGNIILCIIPHGEVDNEDTLFSIEGFGYGRTTTIRFRHHNLNRYACIDTTCEKPHYPLRAISEKIDEDSKDVFVYSKF